MPDIDQAVEQQLADLDPAAWDALCARVRPPEQHPDAKVRAAAALRANRATYGNRTLDSSGRGRLTEGAAPSDKPNACAVLSGHMAVDND